MYQRIIGLAFLGVSAISFAAGSSETSEGKHVKIGFEAGMTFSNVTAPKDVAPSNRSGLAAGINFEVPVGSVFSIQPEALIVQRGSDLLTAGNVRFTAKYTSLEVPLLLKAKLGGDSGPFLLAGPVAIFNLSKSVEAVGPSNGASIGFNPKTVDFAVSVGAGLDLGPFFASARYLVGVSNLSDDSAEWKSRGVHLLVGIRI